MRMIVIALAGTMLGGCVVDTIAKTAVGIVTLPVKVASAAVGAVTTSQAEADRKRGRELRKAEQAQGEQARLAAERCRKRRPLQSDICAPPPRP